MNIPPEKADQSPLRREVFKGLAVLALLVLLMMWLAGTFIDKVQPGPPLPRPSPPPLQTHKVERRKFPLVVEQVGTLRSKDEAHVSSRVMAQVKEILVNEGDEVNVDRQGGLQQGILARLENRDVLARVHQAEEHVSAMHSALEMGRARRGAAEAQLSAARAARERSLSDYRRYSDLHRNQAATGQQLQHMKSQRDVAVAQAAAGAKELEAAEQELERLQAQLKQAEAALTEARVMLGYTAIRAPFSGRVVKKLVNVGDMVAPGQPMFIMESVSNPEIHAFVTESLVPGMKVGQEMTVRIDALDRTIAATLREIVPKSDPKTRTLLVKLSLAPDPSFVNGMFARIEIPRGEYEALVIPNRSVREIGQLQLVEVLDPDGQPQRRFVTLGKRCGDLVEVLSGLREGEPVIVP